MNTEITRFDEIYPLFFYRIEKDDGFWEMYNVSESEVTKIALDRAKNYLLESLYIITEYSDSDLNWFDYEEQLDCFNFQLTNVEKNLLASIMFERHLEREISKLKTFEVNFTPTDLQVFSPSNSRKTFMEMFNYVKEENRTLLSLYSSKDRNNKRKMIDYAQSDE